MLLGFVVLVEVDACSVVVLHGVAGQQLSERKHTHIKMTHLVQFLFVRHKKTTKKNGPPAGDVTARWRRLTRSCRRQEDFCACQELRTYLTKLSTCDMDAS